MHHQYVLHLAVVKYFFRTESFSKLVSEYKSGSVLYT
ncbi:Uncharacterised protein [Serratia fonticola]|uniref:Uncharacterized protein n=1 Tax=Serratia fonticola TaxID=47917 RepID=A0A4U9WEQ7_SERFO|nr:Uncharacterised protein [Serratia fonticola]VTR57509.1 Uncharacterised protein [Serratia fonticola]